MATDGSVNRHGGSADMESNADERARERAEAVEERMREILVASGYVAFATVPAVYGCPECEDYIDSALSLESHLATCELLRARAEAEVDRG